MSNVYEDCWQYFDKEIGNQSAHCKICFKLLQCKASSTSGLHRHLERIHGMERAKTSDNNPDEPSTSKQKGSFLQYDEDQDFEEMTWIDWKSGLKRKARNMREIEKAVDRRLLSPLEYRALKLFRRMDPDLQKYDDDSQNADEIYRSEQESVTVNDFVPFTIQNVRSVQIENSSDTVKTNSAASEVIGIFPAEVKKEISSETNDTSMIENTDIPTVIIKDVPSSAIKDIISSAIKDSSKVLIKDISAMGMKDVSTVLIKDISTTAAATITSTKIQGSTSTGINDGKTTSVANSSGVKDEVEEVVSVEINNSHDIKGGASSSVEVNSSTSPGVTSSSSVAMDSSSPVGINSSSVGINSSSSVNISSSSSVAVKDTVLSGEQRHCFNRDATSVKDDSPSSSMLDSKSKSRREHLWTVIDRKRKETLAKRSSNMHNPSNSHKIQEVTTDTNLETDRRHPQKRIREDRDELHYSERESSCKKCNTEDPLGGLPLSMTSAILERLDTLNRNIETNTCALTILSKAVKDSSDSQMRVISNLSKVLTNVGNLLYSSVDRLLKTEES